MTLAVMYASYRDELICDMAETYHVYDLRALPVETLATLAAGLRENSRVKMKMAGIKYFPAEIVLPHFFDAYITANTPKEDRYKLKLLTDRMVVKQAARNNMAFKSGADFMAAREKLMERIDGNG